MVSRLNPINLNDLYSKFPSLFVNGFPSSIIKCWSMGAHYKDVSTALFSTKGGPPETQNIWQARSNLIRHHRTHDSVMFILSRNR
jgi:hypothetical protein